jgi:lipopolysaccharide/colanic/teichoic acid biosynthesis glycosyltransferase
LAFFTWDKRDEHEILELPLIPGLGDGKDELPPEQSNQATLAQPEADSTASIELAAGIEQWPDLLDLPVASDSLPTQTHSYRVVKRLCDLLISILLLPLLSVLLVVIGVVVALTSGFPVFYRQHRLGQYGKTFRIFKFRTMRNNADQALAEWLLHHPEIRLEWERTHKLKRDPRITKLGRFLRDTSLDEIPQIINVLRGEMSLVGPRPIVQAERSRYAERYVYYSEAVPGITGVWQVSGRCNVSYEDRVLMDEDYVRHWSLRRDLAILLRTPRSVLRRDGAC